MVIYEAAPLEQEGAEEQVWGASSVHGFGARFAWLAVDDIGIINQLSAFEITITNWGVTIGKMKRLIFIDQIALTRFGEQKMRENRLNVAEKYVEIF